MKSASCLCSAVIATVVAIGCSGSQSPAPCPTQSPATSVATVAPSASIAAPAAAPTVEDARKFLDEVDRDLKRLFLQRDYASWVNQTHITDDTDLLAAHGEEATMEYLSAKIREARRFDNVALPEDLARKIMLLRLAGSAPAPNDSAKRSELASLLTQMSSLYGKGKFCPERLKGSKKPCLAIGDLDAILAKSRKYDELTEAWSGWHAISPPIREKFVRYVELSNTGAKDIGFDDLGAMWRAGYDMSPAQFEAEVDRLWVMVKPLYDELHCYVRAQLRKHYGAEKLPEKAPIPAHLLGNMWAQEWSNIYDLVAPFPKEGSLDVSKKLAAKKYDARQMVKLGEKFFTSLGMDPLPQTFWDRSMFLKPQDRDVVCHASAWDIGSRNDIRIKMCIKPTEDDLITIHHELGHIYYFHEYFNLPILFQNGANDGFHEGIGDTLALSVTPHYLAGLGLIDAEPKGDHGRINEQMKQALDKIAFLPFGLLIDKWRWDVFSGKTPPSRYNQTWWELRTRYQGITPPVTRSENDFDPGAKYHIPANTSYMRYFLARILQFQFHRALCKASGHTGPLDTCSIYGNKAAGEKLQAMLRLGASKPWPEALKTVSGESQIDPSAMIEYFAPLRAFLREQNKGQTCGW